MSFHQLVLPPWGSLELMLPFAFVVVCDYRDPPQRLFFNMTCAVLVSVVTFLPSPLSFSSVSVFSPFSTSLSLSPVSFPLFLTFLSFLREDCLTYLTCSELHCDPSPLTLPHFPFLPSSMSSFFPDPFSFICLLFLVPFFKLFSAKSSF